MSSKRIAQVSEAFWPSLCSTSSMPEPGLSVGTMKPLMRFLPAAGSLTAWTTAMPAIFAEAMNRLAPLRR